MLAADEAHRPAGRFECGVVDVVAGFFLQDGGFDVFDDLVSVRSAADHAA